MQTLFNGKLGVEADIIRSPLAVRVSRADTEVCPYGVHRDPA